MFLRFPCWFRAQRVTAARAMFLPLSSLCFFVSVLPLRARGQKKRKIGYATSTCVFFGRIGKTASLTIDMGQLYTISVVAFRSADGVSFFFFASSLKVAAYLAAEKKKATFYFYCVVISPVVIIWSALLRCNLPEVILVTSQLFRRILVYPASRNDSISFGSAETHKIRFPLQTKNLILQRTDTPSPCAMEFGLFRLIRL
ncbi:hypothetical protein VTN96DRAFT_1038 [Rasamsonia emersonii]